MLIEKKYISPPAHYLIQSNPLAKCAYNEVANSILNNVTPGHDVFILNNTGRNCNGVVPVKERCYQILEDTYGWYREKPLSYFHDDAKKGGPIDVYKEFCQDGNALYAGLEFETGNISSAHRSMNKLCIGLVKEELSIAFLMMPIKAMSFYLTDRVANYEELEPYFLLLNPTPFVVFGFNAEEYSPNVPLLPKGKDGMSPRTIRRWQDR